MRQKKKLANEPFALYMYLCFTCTYEDILYTYKSHGIFVFIDVHKQIF